MKYHDIVGQVQHRARVADMGDAVKALRVVLQTLGTRLDPGERQHLAAQLPEEIAYYLKQVRTTERYDLQTFYKVISAGEDTDLPKAMHHAKAVTSVLREAVTEGEARDIAEQLPNEFSELFEYESESA